MTRGKFVLLTEKGMDISIEFNGDMYNTKVGHGPEVIERLLRTNDSETLEKEVQEFNQENFGYEETPLTFHENIQVVDCKESTYFEKWFSDYLYIKNADTKTRDLIDYNGVEHIINPGEIIILDFGRTQGLVDTDGNFINLEPSEEDEADGSTETVLEAETIRSLTLDGGEIEKLYNKGYIKAIPPTVEELTDAIHCVINNM